jgi:hypothetical protein
MSNASTNTLATRLTIIVKARNQYTTQKDIKADWNAGIPFTSIIRNGDKTITVSKNDPLADKYPIAVQYISRGKKAYYIVNQ